MSDVRFNLSDHFDFIPSNRRFPGYVRSRGCQSRGGTHRCLRVGPLGRCDCSLLQSMGQNQDVGAIPTKVSTAAQAKLRNCRSSSAICEYLSVYTHDSHYICTIVTLSLRYRYILLVISHFPFQCVG